MTNKQISQLRQFDATATGNRVAVAFTLDGRSQMDCARETGFTPQYVSDVKSGRFRNLSLDNAHRFAAFFGCAIEDLFPAREAVAS
jgi:transcriptional regulator with XRE-family HTH domain